MIPVVLRACLRKMTTCCLCLIPGNDIGDEGLKALSPHLGKLASLTVLHFSCTCW